MSRKLRIFISSTMKDLRNERFAVVERLRSYNFDPVNAEGWGPDGNSSWLRIESEIESSDLFVLIIGEKYGWIPTDGSQSHLGLSVTHLELKKARVNGITVLPFLKKLEYDTDRTTDDAKKRDEFRKEIRDWKDGYFTTEFELAADLADGVGQAVMNILMDDYYKNRVRVRSSVVTSAIVTLNQEPKAAKTLEGVVLPVELVNAVRKKEAILFAGSGISLSAGFPSANAIAQSLVQLIHESDPDYTVNPTGAALAGIATDLAALRGRSFLDEFIKKIIDSPQGVEPTSAHLKAVTLFNNIITTNYDSLFELAALSNGICLPSISAEIEDILPQNSLLKLHGSTSESDSLLLTENEVFMFDKTRPNLWNAVLELLNSKMVIVVGASLHDPSIIRLFSEVGGKIHGYFVAPDLWKSTYGRVDSWNLECIKANANDFMKELALACNSKQH